MNGDLSLADLQHASQNAQRVLLDHLTADRHWRGHLSSSALSTAVAVFALDQTGDRRHTDITDAGRTWLRSNVNADGGWGDTTDSPSNLSTTVLAWCALSPASSDGTDPVSKGAANWIAARTGGLEPHQLATAVLASYGNDKTFSAPILSLCALAGKLGSGEDAWSYVPQLPFELSVLPHQAFSAVNLRVVSYAIPALIAIGLLRHTCTRDAPPPAELLRNLLTKPALRQLAKRQPDSGGFLEAVPLTAFVLMSLCGAGLSGHSVATRCCEFLAEMARPDGSWPIDADLATWVTTLSINALARNESGRQALFSGPAPTLKTWLLHQQHRRIHPFTHAQPGGWAWTDLSGGVPDADDTSGALLALHQLGKDDDAVREAARVGVAWLLDVQNMDGGIPTFCRGWGKLPFDRSCPDISAHALQALDAWYPTLPRRTQRRMDTAMANIIDYLDATQDREGAWTPLWFGNQRVDGHHNRTYGTARVLTALTTITPTRLPDLDILVARGTHWLEASQNGDGGWGGDGNGTSSVEETALALQAIVPHGAEHSVKRGVAWLMRATDGGTTFPAAPIGLYFASLWYSEQLYPVAFTAGALADAAYRLQS